MTLPLLKQFSSKIKRVLFKPYIFLIITHLLNDSLSFFEVFETLCDQDDIYIVGIPYSTKEPVLNQLKEKFKIFNPKFPLENYIDSLKKILKQVFISCREKHKKLVIIEDGGYATPLIYSDFTGEIENYYGTVEQTTNGIWRDEKIPILNSPILTVAYNELKKKVEGPEIAKAVLKNLHNLIDEDYFLAGKKVLVLGYGTIGENIALKLKQDGSIPLISDISYVKLVQARLQGYITEEKRKLIKQADMIIGATGTSSLSLYDYLLLKDDVILVNASSKQVEFNITQLKNLSESFEEQEIGLKFKLMNGKTVTLLANGYPINFFQAESVPPKIIDLILTELLLTTHKLISEIFDPKIYKKCVIDEDELSELFLRLYFE